MKGRKGEKYEVDDEIGAGDFGIVGKAVREGEQTLFAATVFSSKKIELMEQMSHGRPSNVSFSRTCTDGSLENIIPNTRMKSER